MADIYQRETWWAKQSRLSLAAAYRDWVPMMKAKRTALAEPDWLIEAWLSPEGLPPQDPLPLMFLSNGRAD